MTTNYAEKKHLLDALEGEEILSQTFEGVVLVKNGQIIQYGEVIDPDPHRDTLAALLGETLECELGPDWEEAILDGFSPEPRRYAAVYNSVGMTCCTIIADNKGIAHNILMDQLTRNPSRKAYYDGWAENGFQIKEMS